MSTPEPRRSRRSRARRPHPAQLADVLERVLDKGIVIAGDIKIELLDIELLTIKLRLLIASADKAKEMGIDWWEGDPFVSSRGRNGRRARGARPARSRASSASGTATAARAQRASREEEQRLSPTGVYVYGVAPADDTERPTTSPASIPTYPGRARPGRRPGRDREPRRPRRLRRARRSPSARASSTGSRRARSRTRSVLEQALRAGRSLLPFRFGTIYLDTDQVTALLRERSRELSDALERVRDRVELGVRGALDRARGRGRGASAPTRSSQRLAAEVEGASSGAAYMRRKQLERVWSRPPSTAPPRSSQHGVHERLAAVAEDARSNPPRDRDDGLVADPERRLPRRTRRAATPSRPRSSGSRPSTPATGLVLEPTGPWPPYNFVPEEPGVVTSAELERRDAGRPAAAGDARRARRPRPEQGRRAHRRHHARRRGRRPRLRRACGSCSRSVAHARGGPGAVLILYAVADRPLPSPLPPGACGEPLVQLDVGRRRRASPAPSSRCPSRASRPALAHARVVDALAELADPLLPVPLRVGARDARGARQRRCRQAASRSPPRCARSRGASSSASAASRRRGTEPRRRRSGARVPRAPARRRAARRARPRPARRARPRGPARARQGFRGLVSRPARCGSTPSSTPFASARRTSPSSAWSAPGRGRRTASPGRPRERARPDRRGPRPRASARRGRRSRARLQAACERRPGAGRARPGPARAHPRRAPAPADGAAGAAADRRGLARRRRDRADGPDVHEARAADGAS